MIVSALLSIGEFATVTHLSVKTLRHYHDEGLLEPERIDPHSGYRYYSTAQVPTAQVIRRFRDLDMPSARSAACSAPIPTSAPHWSPSTSPGSSAASPPRPRPSARCSAC